MQFIRDNLFLVGVGAVLIIGLVILGSLYFSASSDYIAALATFDNLSKDIQGFRPLDYDPAAQKEVAKRQADLDKMRKDIEQTIAKSHQRYDVLKVAGQPAFPLANKMNSQRFGRDFSQAYLDQLAKLRESLKPAKLVNKAKYDQALADEIVSMTEYLKQKEAEKAAADAAAAEGNNAPAPVVPGAMPLGPGRPPMPGGAGIPTGAPADATSLATQRVVYLMQMEQANSGRLYADMASFAHVWDSAVSGTDKTKPQDLWQAQVNLWVQKDIVDAINIVNDAVLAANKKSKTDPDSVMLSGIRQVDKIQVSKEYTASTAGTGATPTNYPQAIPAGPGRPPMPGQMPGAFPPGAAAPASTDTTGLATPGFTGRASCKDYDVVQYSFTVVMPAYLVLDLQKALYGLSYHTVLSVEMAPVEDSKAGTTPTAMPARPMGGLPGVGGADQELAPVGLFYGPGTFMKVTIRGEFLLPAAWQRGTFDATQAKWLVNPLVPYEVLSELNAKSPDALRPEDMQRVTDKNNMQPMPTAGALSPTGH